MDETCAVVLAAGAATRFGSAKQLAMLDGRPLLEHAVRAACAAPSLDRVVVVLGAHAPEVRAAVDPGRATFVVCEDWHEGVSASLRCAVDAAGDAARLVVLLGDEPRMAPAAIDAVVRAARAAPAPIHVARARWGGRPGHPVVFARTLFGALRELHGDVGARELIEAGPRLELDCDRHGAPGEVDTPGDLAALTSAAPAPPAR